MTVLRSGSATDVGPGPDGQPGLCPRVAQPLRRGRRHGRARGRRGGGAGGRRHAPRAFSAQPTVVGLREAFAEANTAVWRQSQVQSELRGMGTTLTAVALVVGRRRAGRARPGQRRRLAGVRVLGGPARPGHGRPQPGRGEGAPGGDHRRRGGRPPPAPHPDPGPRDLRPTSMSTCGSSTSHTGDRVLLCSDGLNNEVTSERDRRRARCRARSRRRPPSTLVELANRQRRRRQHHGGRGRRAGGRRRVAGLRRGVTPRPATGAGGGGRGGTGAHPMVRHRPVGHRRRPCPRPSGRGRRCRSRRRPVDDDTLAPGPPPDSQVRRAPWRTRARRATSSCGASLRSPCARATEGPPRHARPTVGRPGRAASGADAAASPGGSPSGWSSSSAAGRRGGRRLPMRPLVRERQLVRDHEGFQLVVYQGRPGRGAVVQAQAGGPHRRKTSILPEHLGPLGQGTSRLGGGESS